MFAVVRDSAYRAFAVAAAVTASLCARHGFREVEFELRVDWPPIRFHRSPPFLQNRTCK